MQSRDLPPFFPYYGAYPIRTDRGEKSENLLLNILPHDIADRLKAGETDIATKHDNITILFADIVNFTPQSQNLSPNKVVNILNKIL